MSPKRPIIGQKITPAKPAAPAKPPAPADTERDEGPSHGGATPGTGSTTTVAGLAARAGAHTGSGSLPGAVTKDVSAAAGAVLGTSTPTHDVFDATSKLDQRAGRASETRDALRDRARHGVQDDASDGDGTTGITDQGSGAVSAKPGGAGSTAGGHSSAADIAESRRLFEAELAKTSDRHVYDPDSDDPKQRVFADQIDPVSGEIMPELAPLVPDEEPELAPLLPDDPPKGAGATAGGTTGTKSADPEHQHDLDPDKAALTGLDDFVDRLRPTPVAGGGDTDPVDDGDTAFGAGARVGTVPVGGAAGSTLLGGDRRGVDVGSGGAGGRVVDPGGHAGAIDHGPDADPGFGGGGLEDDPLDHGQGPRRDLTDRSADDGADDGANDDGANDDGADDGDAPRLLDRPRSAVTDRKVALGSTGDRHASDAVDDAEREEGPSHDDGGAVSGLVPDRTVAGAVASNDGASNAVADAARRVLGTRQDATDVFDPTSALDERAGRAAGERASLRDRARHGAQDDAADGDGTTGITDQGTGAIAEEPATKPPTPFTGGATLGKDNVQDGEVRASVSTDIANDPDFADNPLVQFAKGANTLTTGRSIREANAALEDSPSTAGAAAGTAAPTTEPVLVNTPGGTKFIHPDGSTVVDNRDGTRVENDGKGTTTITHPDGSTTTQSTDAEGNTTVVEKDAHGTTTSTTDVGSVDDEHQHRLSDDDAARLGLDRFEQQLRGPGVAGGGNTDPVDDDGFGSGAVVGGAVIGAAGGAGAAGSVLLTGGDTRGVDVGSGGAGGRPIDPSGSAGAIDLGPDADPGFGGGGLEDDPLAGTGPSRGLDGRGSATVDDTDQGADDDIDEGEPSTEAPFRLLDPSGLRSSVLDHIVDIDTDDDTANDGDDDTDDDTP